MHIIVQNLALDLHRKKLPALTSDTIQRESSELKMMAACKGVARIIEWQQRTISLTYFSSFLPQCSNVAAHNLREFLPRPGIPAIFQILITGLAATSRRWTIARGILKMLWITLRERALEAYITEQTLQLLKLSAVDN